MIKKLFARWLRYRISRAYRGGFGACTIECQEIFDWIYPKPLLSWKCCLETLRFGSGAAEEISHWVLTGEKELPVKTDQQSKK